MTDQNTAGGEAMPAQSANQAVIAIDPVAALFERREAFERSQSLVLADEVRRLDHLCRQQQDTITAQAELIQALKAPPAAVEA